MLEKIKTLLLLVLLGAVALLAYDHYLKKRKLGYIVTNKVFDEFVLKKELEEDLKKIQMAKQSYLDSLKFKIQTMAVASGKNQGSEIEEYKRVYLLKEKQFNDESEALFTQYNDKIWKQLNQYIEDYGKEKSYDYIFGSAGQGNLMYAGSSDNLTEEVVKYVNNKYGGKSNK